MGIKQHDMPVALANLVEQCFKPPVVPHPVLADTPGNFFIIRRVIPVNGLSGKGLDRHHSAGGSGIQRPVLASPVPVHMKPARLRPPPRGAPSPCTLHPPAHM